MGKKYIVMVDDNYHYMNEDERYKHGEYDTPEEAISVCKKIVECSIEYENGATPGELYSNYCMFGEDPFIIGDVGFSGRDYAKEYCEKLCQENNKSSLEKALEIAFVAHIGQKDKSGADYIMHPIRVMERGETEIEKICGILHDVVEDSDLTFEDLKKEGFSNDVISVLKCLTKVSEDEDYDNFIDRVIQNPVATKVKLNDLLDNMDITRLKELTEGDMKRLNKYLKAYWKLKNK